MQIGILGLPKAGKTTLFNILTASHASTDKFVASDRTHMGVAKVPDSRLVRLRDLFNPRRFVPATVEYVDIPGMKKGEGKESLDLAKLKGVDALMAVVRAFEDAEIPHPDGAVNPSRDAATLDLELIFADHSLVEKRLEKLSQARKRGLTAEELREQDLMTQVVMPALEAERPLREVTLEPDDERRLRGFQLLSAKPMLLVINVAETGVATTTAESLGIALRPSTAAVVVSAPIEAEISQLTPEDQASFLADLGLSEPSIDRVIQASYGLLGLISFFTVGEDEVRAWTQRRGCRAQDAAGSIHSDIARGFIRAEVVRWDDLLRLKTMTACREAGLLRLEGKDYIVQDGDVAHFRFNV
jgi:GTP-binding protein YchF